MLRSNEKTNKFNPNHNLSSCVIRIATISEYTASNWHDYKILYRKNNSKFQIKHGNGNNLISKYVCRDMQVWLHEVMI